ncbi:AciT family ciprofloxacin tolerance protein [Acinetobacter sp. MB5]|uniref:AciT family ciprofloxacin tolerance protein n=1 Tax=Acinetobacter sp. MB5 TaxID=2069438 RepID=UPI000DCFCC65|nr:AciT family ciprofloxacin tolerance protein [Acinetobacter sp. MB5]
MLTANVASMVGIGLIVIALIAVFFSPFRHWLGFMLAGMAFWGVVETLRLSAQHIFHWPMTYSYLTALSLVMMGITLLLLRADRLAEKALANRQLIEHTPVYDEEQ